MSSLIKKKVAPLPKEKLVLSEKVTSSQKVLKVSNLVNYMEGTVIPICGKGFDNFQGQSTASTSQFNHDHEWLKIDFLYLNQTFIEKHYDNNIEGQYIKT